MSEPDRMSDVLTDRSLPRTRGRAIADQDLDLTPLSSDRSFPSSASPTKRLPTSPRLQNETDQPTAGQLADLARDLQEQNNELAKDRDLADRECRRLRLEADRLRSELRQVREEDPRSKLIREVCDYWIAALGKTKRTKCPVNGARWNRVRARMNDGYSVPQLKAAIDGCAKRPYVGPHGRQATDDRGAKRHDDLELICRDETTVERFTSYTELPAQEKGCSCSPTTGDPGCPVHVTAVQRATRFGDESPESQFVRFAHDGQDQLPYRPASKEPQRRPPRPGAPIERVLGALHAFGCQVVTYQAHADQWSAQCPAHEDRSPSLSIHRNPDGKVLMRCWASCTTEEVLSALGLEWCDLWEDSDRDTGRLSGPSERSIAPHLRQAMQQLLAADEWRAA